MNFSFLHASTTTLNSCVLNNYASATASKLTLLSMASTESKASSFDFGAFWDAVAFEFWVLVVVGLVLCCGRCCCGIRGYRMLDEEMGEGEGRRVRNENKQKEL